MFRVAILPFYPFQGDVVKIRAGDYMVWYADGSIGILRQRPETPLPLELHFADGSPRLKMSVKNLEDFYRLALMSASTSDLNITYVDRKDITQCPAYQFSNAPLFDPTR